MLAILLIAAGLLILLGDPSVKDADGLEKLEKVAKGTKDMVTGQTGAPRPSQDFFGWLFWNGE